MDEMYRMLGKEHEADLEREARKWQRAREVRGRRRAPVKARTLFVEWMVSSLWRDLWRSSATQFASKRLSRAAHPGS
jgi:hypothetical protein